MRHGRAACVIRWKERVCDAAWQGTVRDVAWQGIVSERGPKFRCDRNQKGMFYKIHTFVYRQCRCLRIVLLFCKYQDHNYTLICPSRRHGHKENTIVNCYCHCHRRRIRI